MIKSVALSSTTITLLFINTQAFIAQYRWSPFFKKVNNHLHSRRDDLLNQISLAEAIIARNEAQIESFIDEQHQWEEQDQLDKDLLTALPALQVELDELDT